LSRRGRKQRPQVLKEPDMYLTQFEDTLVDHYRSVLFDLGKLSSACVDQLLNDDRIGDARRFVKCLKVAPEHSGRKKRLLSELASKSQPHSNQNEAIAKETYDAIAHFEMRQGSAGRCK